MLRTFGIATLILNIIVIQVVIVVVIISIQNLSNGITKLHPNRIF
jgi:hypothetical protein